MKKQRKESKSLPCLTFDMNPHYLAPSKINSKVYRPVDPDDPAIIELARDITKNGVLVPLVITTDSVILSGHRRRAAAILAGLKTVPCRQENIHSGDDAFLARLVSYNSQRIKNHTEQLREVVVNTNPEEAYEQLIEHRRGQSTITAETIDVGFRGERKGIGPLKDDMRHAVIRVLNSLIGYWPVSVRQIHYRLLDNPPVRNTNKQNIYENDLSSYKDLCNLLTRLRLNDTIPMTVISDETRPVVDWNVYANAQDFMRQEFDDFLKGYRRGLQQTQPIHIEVVGEKLTIQPYIRAVCMKFNIPYTIGRGYNSLPPRHAMVERFKKSGKDKLCMIILGDHDPEGIDIGESLLQSIREDFHVYDAEAVRAGLNFGHVRRFGLIDNKVTKAKISSRYKKYVEQYGERVFELDALSPKQIQEILTEAIDGVLDKELFNIELDAEKQDAAYIQAVRERVLKECSGFTA